MRNFILKRIFYFIPALIFLVLFSFILLHYAPGDTAERLLNGEGLYENDISPGFTNEKEKNVLIHRLGLDLPVFYFSISRYSEISSPGKYIPQISFHGENQFHRWLFGDEYYSDGIIRGDFGISWITQEPVSSIIFSRLQWSLFFTITSVIIAYLISIPAGLISAANPGSGFDRLMTILLTILFSLPVFWRRLR